MIELAGQQFPPNLACITCEHVLAGDPVNRVSLDEDGDLQFLCGRPHEENQARVVGLGNIMSRAPELAQLPAMVEGQSAERTGTNDWVVS